jgi:hypothetical protein
MHAEEAAPATITSPGAAPLHHDDGSLLDELLLQDPEVAASALAMPQIDEDAAVPLTLEETSSSSYWDDMHTPVPHPIAAPAADMMANMDGTTHLALPIFVFPAVCCGNP